MKLWMEHFLKNNSCRLTSIIWETILSWFLFFYFLSFLVLYSQIYDLVYPNGLQAGNFGVLQGAERFDQSRGYKFSTYVQYWIRKSMSMLVARHARGVRIPVCDFSPCDIIYSL